MSDQNHTPIFNELPFAVIAIAAVMALVEAMVWLGGQGIIGGAQGIGWRVTAVQEFAFSDVAYNWMVSTGAFPFEHLKRFVTYPFVHGSLGHAAFSIVFVLAMGKFAGQVFSNLALVVIFFGASVFGALVYAWLLTTPLPLFGGMPGAYGLIGAYTFLLFVRAVNQGENGLQAFYLIGFLVAIQLLFGLLYGTDKSWVAELAGFAAGFVLCFVVRPGGLQALRDRIQRR